MDALPVLHNSLSDLDMGEFEGIPISYTGQEATVLFPGSFAPLAI